MNTADASVEELTVAIVHKIAEERTHAAVVGKADYVMRHVWALVEQSQREQAEARS